MRSRDLEQWDVRWVLAVVAVLVMVLSAIRIPVFWRSEAYLNSPAGYWTGLAVDLAAGVFYRPLVGPDGYGGTRYFPFHFSLHAVLIRLGIDPIVAGHLLAVLAVALLAVGVYRLLRWQGASRDFACSVAVLVLACQPAQRALLSIRGDGLAVALTMWGLGYAIGRRSLGNATVFFALAFATKMTAVHGAVAAIGWLALGGHRREAWRLGASCAACYAFVLGLMYFASGGAAFEVLWAAGPDSLGVRDILWAPVTLMRVARESPETVLFIQLGCAAFVLQLLQGRWKEAPSLFFAATALVMIVIFAGDGSDTNHLLDLQVASLVLVGAWASDRGRPAQSAGFAMATLAIAGLVGSSSLAFGIATGTGGGPQTGTIADTLRHVPDRAAPILAENPLVPIEAGQRPYVLDTYLLRVVRQRRPGIEGPLWDRIAERRFGAVVLERDPTTDRGQAWYLSVFGEGFIPLLEQHYLIADRVGSRVIYVPKGP